MQTQKETKKEHASTKLANGMGGVMIEGGLQGWKNAKSHVSKC
jgi:hypothetical protein